jgi:hypothetical protein
MRCFRDDFAAIAWQGGQDPAVSGHRLKGPAGRIGGEGSKTLVKRFERSVADVMWSQRPSSLSGPR